MLFYNNFLLTVLLFVSLGKFALAENQNYIGVAGGEWVTGVNWSGEEYPSEKNIAVLNTTVNMSVEAPNNLQAIAIGTQGKGRLQIGSLAKLKANASELQVSRIGSGKGNQGAIQQEGGIVILNQVAIGGEDSAGAYHLHSGALEITSENKGYSLFLGSDISGKGGGRGSFSISAGRIKTRAGIYLGSNEGGKGTFEVIGSHSIGIDVGSLGSLSGGWIQNNGSVLKVRIDKTKQGITPIFIDNVEKYRGGNVLFKKGAILDVDFTTSLLNGGTFTVMEWEGQATDQGLEFASSVDTNIWSFKVDNANKQLTVTAKGEPLKRQFVHPGLSHKLSDLERMRDMVAAGVEPYASSFQALRKSSRAQYTYMPHKSSSELVKNKGEANNNALRADGVAAYYNALMWFITGNEKHAETSIRIFNAWTGVKSIGSFALNAGRHWRLIEAAEIIKHTYDGWDPEEIQAFSDMLLYPGYSNTTPPEELNGIYWAGFQGDSARHGNQGLFAMRVIMAIGVFLDNEVIYDRALRYLQGAPARKDDIPYPSGPPIIDDKIASYEHFDEFRRKGEEKTISNYGYNEVMHNYIYPNGQSQEFSRDMAHGLAGIGIISTMSEIAWTQGDDLYGHLDNRPLLGQEYYFRYNLSLKNTYPDQPKPWEPTAENGEFIQRRDQSGRWFSLKANPYLAQNVGEEHFKRGKFNHEPGYEMNLAHYRDRINVAPERMIWLERGLELILKDPGFEKEGTPWDHASWGSLTFRRVSPGDPVNGFSNGNPSFALHKIPTTIQAENFDYFPINGQGRTYHDLTKTNSGKEYRLNEGLENGLHTLFPFRSREGIR